MTLTQSPANALGTGTGVSYTLEGCRITSTTVLPNVDGDFICPDGLYTTGNLGKGWNELDLVPARVTLDSGNSTPGTFAFALVVDNEDAGHPGYDFLSVPVLNEDLSSGDCGSIIVSEETIESPGLGGSDESRYRLVTVTGMGADAVCVYDAYARLALGSHLYPGSSLHFNLANDQLTTAGIGSKEVSIPVKEIQPQQLSKTMTAVKDSAFTWQVEKSANPVSLTFEDTCDPNATLTAPVAITVTWTKLAANPTGYTLTTVVTATNPAHRTIRVTATDVIKAGNTVLDNATGSPVDVGANSSATVLTHTFSITPAQLTLLGVDPDAPNFNDTATATYTDLVTGIPVPGQTSATASVANGDIGSGSTTGDSIDLVDTESMTGTGLDFSVATPSVGAFDGYTAGQFTTGPVVWKLDDATSSGSVTFNKTVRVSSATATSGTLSDTVTGTFGGSTTTASASTSITSNALVDLTINKRRSPVTSEDQTFNFNVKDASDVVVASTSITIPGGTPATTDISTTVNNLPPGTYTVVEPATGPYPGDSKTATITLPACSGSVSFNNVAAPAGARVQKITAPTGNTVWEFTLSGPDVGASGTETVNATAGAGYVNFTSALGTDGATYTITETAKSGWDTTSIAGDFNGNTGRASTDTATRTCSFTLDLPDDSGGTFSCTFTNTQRGRIIVEKQTNPDGATQAFEFDPSYQDNFFLTDGQQNTSGELQPGTYSVAEVNIPAGWDLTSATCNDGSPVSAISLQAGETVTCVFTNTKRGHVTVIKTENGGNPTHAYSFRLTGGPDNVDITKTTDPAPGSGGETLDFGLLKPGTYTLCELAVPAGTHSTLEDQGGVLDPNTGDICLQFTLAAGEEKSFTIDNSMPGGGQRTIGYWRNWNSCNDNGGDWVARSAKTGNHLLDEFLPQTLGTWVIDTCEEARSVLDAAKGKYAENQLAAQLLAAKLNVAAGASTCQQVANAITHGDALLAGIGYSSATSKKVGPKHSQRADFLATAALLDDYNNGNVC